MSVPANDGNYHHLSPGRTAFIPFELGGALRLHSMEQIEYLARRVQQTEVDLQDWYYGNWSATANFLPKQTPGSARLARSDPLMPTWIARITRTA